MSNQTNLSSALLQGITTSARIQTCLEKLALSVTPRCKLTTIGMVMQSHGVHSLHMLMLKIQCALVCVIPFMAMAYVLLVLLIELA